MAWDGPGRNYSMFPTRVASGKEALLLFVFRYPNHVSLTR